MMVLEFSGIIFYWRGPSPYFFVAVPPEQSSDIKAISGLVTYGWGVIPAAVRIGATEFTTSLFPRKGGYVVPIKDVVRKAEDLDQGDTVSVRLEIR